MTLIMMANALNIPYYIRDDDDDNYGACAQCSSRFV